MYTTTVRRDEFPGGIERLDDMAYGGDLFDTFLFQPVSLIV